MGKQRISSADLNWIISEEFTEASSRRAPTTLAVVADVNHGWRVIVGKRARRFLTAVDERRLEDIQLRLREVYKLRS